jgi:hypothetical protein
MLSNGKTEKNAVAILHAMASVEMISQAQLMPLVHLKRTSIFNVMEQMHRARLVRPCGNFSTGKGRGTILWKLTEDAGAFVVAYFGNQHNYYRVYDYHGDLLHGVDRPYSSTIDDAIAELQRVISQFSNGQKVGSFALRGVVVSLAATVDSIKGEIAFSHNWRLKQYPLGAELSKLWKDSPPLILVENNARLAAWGEKCTGLSRENQHLILLAIHGASGSDRKQTAMGLGTGIVLDGKLFAGAGGGAGELDQLFTRWLVTHYPNGNRPRTLAEMTDRQLREFVLDLGENFSHIVNYLAPEKLVVHFDEEPPSPAFVKRLRDAMQANLLPGTDRNFPVEMSTRGVDLLLDGGIHRLRQLYFAPSEHLSRQIREAFDRR